MRIFLFLSSLLSLYISSSVSTKLLNGFRTDEPERNVLSELYSAIKYGNVDFDENVAKASSVVASEVEKKAEKKSLLYNGILSTIRQEYTYNDHAPFTMMIYGSGNGELSVSLAQAWSSKSTVMSVETDENLRNEHLRRRGRLKADEYNGLGNNLICTGEGHFDTAKEKEDLDDVSFFFGSGAKGSSHLAEEKEPFEVRIFERMEATINGRLPHEFEEWVGQVIRSSRIVVFQETLPDLVYFAYWEDMRDLIRAAVSNAGVRAKVFDVSAKETGPPTDIWKSGGAATTSSTSAIVIVRTDMETSNDSRGRVLRTYNPRFTKHLHVGSSNTDYYLVPNTNGFVVCDNEHVVEATNGDFSAAQEQPPDRFEVTVSPAYIGVRRVDPHPSRGWGLDLKLTCETSPYGATSSAEGYTWSEPVETFKHVFTTWYVPWRALQRYGLIPQDRRTLLGNLVRTMPALPFVNDENMAIASNGIDSVHLYYGAQGTFHFALESKQLRQEDYFGIPKNEEPTKDDTIVTILTQSREYRHSEIETGAGGGEGNGDGDAFAAGKQLQDGVGSERSGDNNGGVAPSASNQVADGNVWSESSSPPPSSVFDGNVASPPTSEAVPDTASSSSVEATRLARARTMHVQLNAILEEKLPLETIEAMTNEEMDQLDEEIAKVKRAQAQKKAGGEQQDHTQLRGGGRRLMSIFNLHESQDQRVYAAAMEKWQHESVNAAKSAASKHRATVTKKSPPPSMLMTTSRKTSDRDRIQKAKRALSKTRVRSSTRAEFQRLWQIFGPELSKEVDQGAHAEPWTALVYGESAALELLALRVARSWPQSSDLAHNSGATVVSVVRDKKRAERQVAMAELLGLENAPVCHLPKLSADTTKALVDFPDQRFKYAILGFDAVWGPLFDDHPQRTQVGGSGDSLSGGSASSSSSRNDDVPGGDTNDSLALEEHVGMLLHLGRTVYMEVPSASALAVALWFNSDCHHHERNGEGSHDEHEHVGLDAFHAKWKRWSDSLLETGAKGSGSFGDSNFIESVISAAFDAFAPAPASSSNKAKKNRPVATILETNDDVGTLSTRWIRVSIPENGQDVPRSGESFVSLYALLHLQVVPQVKAELFRLFMQLHPPSSLRKKPEDLARAFAPWNVRLRPGNGGDTDAMLMPAPYPGISNGVLLGEWWRPVVSVLETEETKRIERMREEARFLESELKELERSNARVRATDRQLYEQILKFSSGGASRLRDAFADSSVFEHLRREHELRNKIEQKKGLADTRGALSFVEWNSGPGTLSMGVASAFPNATVVSVTKTKEAADLHYELSRDRGILNNQICVPKDAASGDVLHPLDLQHPRAFHDSPEMFRYQMLGGSFVELVALSDSLRDLGTRLGVFFTLSLTTFMQMPHPAVLSLALTTFYERAEEEGEEASFLSAAGPDRRLASARYDIRKHPRPAYRRSTLRLLQGATRLSAGNRVSLRTVDETHLVRVDVVNMTRRVGHHVGWSRDGHRSKYVLDVFNDVDLTKQWKQRGHLDLFDEGVQMNAGGLVRVGLHVASDPDGNKVPLEKQRFIPYDVIRGITLIGILRLGLIAQLRSKSYFNFVHMPLYEDQAPWNIHFVGNGLEYIDSDTKDTSLDDHVRNAYKVLSVLANYKRTVEDFDECSFKAKNGRYNFPYISDCVGSWFSGPCNDPAMPVPCGDGTCHSDYISCLRVLSEKSRERTTRAEAKLAGGSLDAFDVPGLRETVYDAPEAFSSDGFEGTWSYDNKGIAERKDETRK